MTRWWSGWPRVRDGMVVAVLWAGLLGMAQAQAQAVSKGLSFGPAPAWVDAQAAPLDAVPPAEGLSQGRYYLLVDDQLRVAGNTRVHYHHVASRAVNERGVEQVSSVQIRFDPSYQTLTIHRIEVRRGGQTVSRVQPAAVKLLQREASLESLVFDGSLTAHVALSDVRVGDVVEYVYSLQGHNPVFGSHHFGSFDLEWDVPVARMHARLLWPQGRALYWKQHNQAALPRVTEVGGELDHRWAAVNVPGRQVDSDSPGWFDPYVWVEWGEFERWADVARWALPLYRPPAGPLPGVDREVARIAAQTQDPEQRLLAALRFVQREVRYLGIEMGANSHAPHTPELVLQRRFGDCKDKTLLSLALLRGLGIPAQAALVHTHLRQAAADRLPTPWAFNHVLVHAELGGRGYWLDPTRAPQAGAGLAEWVQADFGRALLVDGATEQLVPMAGPQARTLKRHLHALLDASAGFDKPATLTVTTQASGEAAEDLRDALANTARESLQKQYLDFYAASYPGLAVDQPFTFSDNVEANTLELVEHYRLPAYWTRDDKRARWNGPLEVPDLLEWLRSPKGLNRQGPLALRHPVDFTLVSEFRLPGPWDVKPDPVFIDDPAFELRREEVWQGSKLTLTDHYLSRADHVPAADMPRYVAHLDKARAGVNYSLYHQDAAAKPAASTTDGPHWLPLSCGLLSVVALGWLALRLYRWDPAPVAVAAGAPSGLAGWLWLPLIGLVVSPFRIGKLLVESAPTLTVQGWSALTAPSSSAYHGLWAPVLLLETVMNLALCGGSLLVLLLMLRRRSNAPRVYIGLLALGCVTVLFDAVVSQIIPALSQAWTAKDSRVRHQPP
jgi:hypothetical protein